MHPFPLEILMPECTAIPDSCRRDHSASGFQKLSWRWPLPLNMLLAWGCHLCKHTARCEADLLCMKLSLLLTGVHTAEQIRQLSAGGASCIYRYSRNLNMVFLLPSVFLLKPCFHVHSCSEKYRSSNSFTPLTGFLEVKCYCLVELCFLTDMVQCAVGVQPEVLLLTIVRSVLGPWGVLQCSLPSGLEIKERKGKNLNLLSPGKGPHMF